MVSSAMAQERSAPRLEAVTFDAMPDWQARSPEAGRASLQALLNACARNQVVPPTAYGHVTSASDWAHVCKVAQTWKPEDGARFYEAYFQPYRIVLSEGEAGLLTGYYTPLLRGSRVRTPHYNVPVYAPPQDALERTRYSRAQIESGALEGRGLEVVWLDDAVDAFFLHVQGSGYVALEGESELRRLSFAGKNEFPYVAIGRQFIEEGVVSAQEMSMQWLRRWLAEHPQQAPEVMRRNPSYIFFHLHEDAAQVLGAQGTPLTPMHSIAVDPAYIGYGTPLYLSATLPDGRPLYTLVMAQDTGSAIRGALRADLYAGVGEEAGELAGALKSPLEGYVLLPRSAP